MNDFLKIYKERQPADEVIEQIDLYDDDIPRVDKTVLSAWQKQRNGEPLTWKDNVPVQESMQNNSLSFVLAGYLILATNTPEYPMGEKIGEGLDSVRAREERYWPGKTMRIKSRII